MNLFDEINSIMQEKSQSDQWVIVADQWVIVAGHGRVRVGSEIWTTVPGRGKVKVRVHPGMGQRCN